MMDCLVNHGAACSSVLGNEIAPRLDKKYSNAVRLGGFRSGKQRLSSDKKRQIFQMGFGQVTGRVLLDDLCSWDALRAALSICTVCGAPKVPSRFYERCNGRRLPLCRKRTSNTSRAPISRACVGRTPLRNVKVEDRECIEGEPMAMYNNAAKIDQARWQEPPLATDSTGSGPVREVHEDFEACVEREQSFILPSNASAPPKLLHVAVDVDEVLGSFLSTLNKFIAEEYMLHHNLSEYHVYDFMKIWKCSQTEANDRVHAFFKSEHFNNGILPVPGAHQTLLQLASYCHLVVVTSRQHVIRKPTMDWIEQHYSGIFEEVHFGNHFALEGEARPKSEICRSLGVDILVDDNPRYALDCAEHGIEVLLFDLHGRYPWSKTAQGPAHPLITRVRDWSEVEQELQARRH